ncbi:MAG: cell division septation protein DedD [Polaribacter sp.]|jgi:cell division septation protein DedD
MNLDLAPHIYTLLFQQDTVIFPDFGGLVGSYNPASIDYVQGIIYPPSKALVLNERLTTNDGVLEHFVRTTFDLTGDEAILVIKNFIEGMNEALDRGEIVLFPKVGRLYKNYERKLQFLQENTNFNKDTYGLPPIQFYPILRSREAEQVSDAPTPVAEKKMVGKTRTMARWVQTALPIVIGCAVVSIAVSLYFISPVSNADIAGEIQKLPVLETRLNQKPEMEHAGIGSMLRNKEDRHKPVQEKEEIIVPENEIEEPIETEAATYAPAGKECVIIIGAFSKKAGVRSTVEQIYGLGYDAYQDQKRGLTRVGVQLSYEKEGDIDRALKLVRKKINKKAWVLRK